MNAIVFPLKPSMQGASVADLQDALQACIGHSALLANDATTATTLSAALKQERVVQVYGDATTRLVGFFQRERRLQPSGEIDAPTARALNALLRQWGLLEQAPEPVQVGYRVHGRVFSRISAGVDGLVVQIIDRGVGASSPLGAGQIVAGQLSSSQLGDGQLVAARTNDRGEYEASFSEENVRRRGKTQPDLQARVFAGNTLLGASEVRYNASQNETLNVLLGDDAASSLRSEVEVLKSAIAGQYKGNLRDLKETEEQQDITYLANKTGWDARAVALAALADQFSSRTAGTTGVPTIPQEFFYALFRAGLPANDDMLYQADAKALETIWKKAAEQGVIPKASVDQIPQATAAFQTLSAQRLLTGPALIGASSFKEMLTVSRLNEVQQTKFAQLYAASRADMPAFWKVVGDAFGQETANRLQVDGKLGFLTINNSALMQKVHATAGRAGLSDPLQLAQMGYHRAEPWSRLLTAEVPIPKEIPGNTDKIKRDNYASYLAAKVRLSYPTAAVAQMVKSRELPLTGAAGDVADKVHAFLTDHQGKFEIGVHPIQQYIVDRKLQVGDDVVAQVKRLQRVYQITPSDQAMIGLMKRRIDAAMQVVGYDRDTFVQGFAADLGGADQAALTYERSLQIHGAVLNIALSYLCARTAPAIGVHSPAGVLDPAPAHAGDVIAYATLESLFGSMDFCACEHCHSILSPAAYLVDLLQFLGSDKANWSTFASNWKGSQGGHGGASYPFVSQQQEDEFKSAWSHQHPGESPPDTEISPFDVLMSRRPDIQHLPLTCENTNTALPYIDVVNETLEYYVANGLRLEKNSLDEYRGHDTGEAVSDDLLASPQFVMNSAYSILRNTRFPAPLPFHQPLELLRRYFNKFEVPLPLAMERLRKTDDLERGANPYGWRDILMEELALSRDEYQILADSAAVPLWRMYGFPNDATNGEVVAGLSNAKQFCRRVRISYEDLVSILKTRFINPNSDLIPKVERLGVSFVVLKALKDGHFPNGTSFSPSDFNALLAGLAVPPGREEYDGDIAGWVTQADNYSRIMGLITLRIAASPWAAKTAYTVGDCVFPTPTQQSADWYYECTTPGTSASSTEPIWPTTPGKTTAPDGTVIWTCRDPSSCHSFNNMAFRYSDPAKLSLISAVEFARLLRFIRLWKKLGWTIEQTDAAICALSRADLASLEPVDVNTLPALDGGFSVLLPRLAIAKRMMKALNLTVKRDLYSLLSCWSDISTHGASAHYRQMFLNPAILKQDPVFKDNGYGEFLTDSTQTLFATNLTKKAKFAGEITLGDVLSTSINGLVVPYTVVAGDTSITALASHVVSQLNATTAAEPITGKPFNDVIVATTDSDIVIISMKNPQPDGAIMLACSVSDGATETYAPVDHQSALCAAFNITGSEFTLIADDLKFDATTQLSLGNISAIFRRAWLARKLKISVRELLLLIELTGLDPFTAPDSTNPAILQLISLVHALRDRSLKTVVALYLIWNKDLSGKSGPDPAQITELGRTLRGDFASINNQFAAVEDPNGDIARARMTLVYGEETSDAFLALLDDTVVEDVLYTHSSDTLDPAITAADPRIGYDAFRHRLSHRGLMTTEMQEALKNAGGGQNFEDAVGALFARSEDVKDSFFERNPELAVVYDEVLALDQTLTSAVAYIHATASLESTIIAVDKRIEYDNTNRQLSYSGILTAGRRDTLKNVPGVALEFQSALDALFSLSQKARGEAVLAALQPELARRRKRQQALLRLTATVGVDPAVAQVLLDPASKPYPIHAAEGSGRPALDDVLALETPGLEAQFFFQGTATGTPNQHEPAVASLDYAAGSSSPFPNPGNVISGIWSGRIETAETGFYNLVIEADKEASVTLTLNGETRSLTQNGAVRRNDDPIELTAGTLHELELKVENVKDRLSLQWETPKRAREVIPSRYLYPAGIFEPFSIVYVRFLKTASLATGLGLTANELAFLGTHSDYQIAGDGWLNALAVSDDPLPGTTEALLKPFEALLEFARIKSAISRSDESLLAILKDPAGGTKKRDSQLFTITRWDQPGLNDLLTHWGGNSAELDSFELFRRLYDAFTLIEKLGVSAKAMIQATTNEPSAETVRDLQAALRARYDAPSWRDVVRPINDEMRCLQRDALVAYILDQMRSRPESEHIDTPDKLFEYFLMDVEMEACMQTSRIRHALSSVQLFIQRCLMNLEPRVSTQAINAKQWEWMKRYRVWEANRKVFLWPENWLEPELRDDKSAFFKEAESELLQGDITEDTAATALLNYLSKLEEVAKLEPCGIYYAPRDNQERTPEVSHVVARTAGAHRKYYYRRCEAGSWTPWEQIKLDIEDNPVLPLVWKDRFFLFWLRILKQSKMTKPDPQQPGGRFENLDPSTVIRSDAPAAMVHAVLCWSEYYNGKWQPTKTSDLDRGASLGDSDAVGDLAFKRSIVDLLGLNTGVEAGALVIKIMAGGWPSFTVYNTHSLPVRTEDDKSGLQESVWSNYTAKAFRGFPMGLAIYYWENWNSSEPLLKRSVLSLGETPYRVIGPGHDNIANPWLAPFLMEDRRYLFYVTTTEEPLWIPNYPKYGLDLGFGQTQEATIHPLVFKEIPEAQSKPKKPGVDHATLGLNGGDPEPMMQFVAEDAYIRQGIGTTGAVEYGNQQIGPSGAIQKG